MIDIFKDLYIEHHGVKGMKWGVRKDRGSKQPRRPKKESAARRVREQALARRRTLSQKDLDSLVKRLEQEKKLKTLLNEDLNPGRTFVKNSLKTSGGKIITAVGTGIGVTAVGLILASASGDSKVGKIVSDLAANIPKIKK